MNKQEHKENIKSILYNKLYQSLFALFISVSIMVSAYIVYITPIIKNRQMLSDSIKNANLVEVKAKLKELRKQKGELVVEYQKEQDSFNKLKVKIYQKNYPIITDILKKINKYSFNIQSYKLDKEYKKMDVKLEGSYQNLIRFVDFLGTIPADVKIKRYKLTLSEENMMVIELSIEVTPIRI